MTNAINAEAAAAFIEACIEMRLAEIPKDDRSLTGMLCGGPLRGRSALDKRKQA